MILLPAKFLFKKSGCFVKSSACGLGRTSFFDFCFYFGVKSSSICN